MKKLCILILSGFLLTCSEPTSSDTGQSIIGEWSWIKTEGGWAGGIQTPATTGFSQTLVIKENGTLLLYKDSTLLHESRYFFQDDTLVEEYSNSTFVVTRTAGKLILDDLCIDCGVSTYKRVDREVVTLGGVLHWTGPYAVDGCGYNIYINDVRYKAENEEVIDTTFQKPYPVEVSMKISYLDRKVRSWCWDVPLSQEIDGITIHSIKEKNLSWQSDSAFITGPDPRECVCCGGYFIQVNDKTYRFYQLPQGSNLDLDFNATFPVPVLVKWKANSNRCLGDEIEVQNIQKITGSFPQVQIVDSFSDGEYQSDPLKIKNIYVVGDILFMDVTHGGGCKIHGYKLFVSSAIYFSIPPQLEVRIVHDANGDACKALISKTIAFDLKPVKEILFQDKDGHAILMVSVGIEQKIFEVKPIYYFN